MKGSTAETPEAVEMFRHTSKRRLVVDTRRSASAFHASSHDDCVSTRKPHMRFLSHFHGRKLRTPASVETALFSDSLDVKKTSSNIRDRLSGRDTPLLRGVIWFSARPEVHASIQGEAR